MDAPLSAAHRPVRVDWRFLARKISRYVHMLDERDPETAIHCRRVAHYALLLARELRLSLAERIILLVGARLHDIGKIALVAKVLHLPVELSDDERAHVRTHPVLGCHLVSGMPMLAPIVPIVRSHHERWDGRGYPDGLAGNAIPFLARVVAIADTFDAMTSDRAYRAALPREDAFAQIAAGAGTQFDPQLAAAFLRITPSRDERWRTDRATWTTGPAIRSRIAATAHDPRPAGRERFSSGASGLPRLLRHRGLRGMAV